MSKDGGPAFPHERSNEHFAIGNTYCAGMTLRDYFAVAALHGLLFSSASEAGHMGSPKWAPLFAEGAYLIADAMLAEREREK